MSASTLQHILACKRVLRYLKATEDYGLNFSTEEEIRITGYTDADWAYDIDDRKSIGAYCIYFGNNVVSSVLVIKEANCGHKVKCRK